MKYYLLHIKDGIEPILHGPLKTEVSMELKEEEITASPDFSLIEDDEHRADSLICLAVTGHGEIVRATSRVFGVFEDEPNTPHEQAVPMGTDEDFVYAPV